VETGLHALGIPLDDIRVTVEGDLDLQGTLGMSKTVPVGFEGTRVNFHVRAPQATQESGCRGTRVFVGTRIAMSTTPYQIETSQ